jgi:hypothetical protein
MINFVRLTFALMMRVIVMISVVTVLLQSELTHWQRVVTLMFVVSLMLL